MKPHQQLILPRCRACNEVLPKPYRRTKHEWGEVHYTKCACGQNEAIDVIGKKLPAGK